MTEQLPPLKIGVLHCTPHAKGHTPHSITVGNWALQKLKELEPTCEIKEVDAGRLLIAQDLGHYYEKSHFATYPDASSVSSRVAGDQMSQVIELLLESHAVLITMDVRMGTAPALFSTIMERMQSSLMAPRGMGTPLKNKVAGVIAIGHSDGATNAISHAIRCLSQFRMVLPPTSHVFWSGSSLGGPTHFDLLKIEDSDEIKAWTAELAGSMLDTTRRQVKDGLITVGMQHADAFKKGYLRMVLEDMQQAGLPHNKQGAEDYLKLIVRTRRLNRTQLMPYWAVLRAKFGVDNYPK